MIRFAVLVIASLTLSNARAQTPRAPVTVAIPYVLSDLGILLADSRGYFRDEGLDVTFVPVDAAARVLPSLAVGDIDVAAGAPTASFYNLVSRGVGVRIVADKGATPPGRYSQTLVVRKALVDSGRVKSISDLKGLRVASAARGSSSMGTFERLYKLSGLKANDFEHVILNVPQQITALQNGAIDAGFPSEPIATMAVRQGIAAKLMTDDEIYPGHQIITLFYSTKFRVERPREALAFMRAYLRGVRAANKSIIEGRIAGADAEEMLTIVTTHTPLKDKELARALVIPNCNDDGMPNIASLAEDLDVFRREGLLEGKVAIAEALDLTFVNAANSDLARGR
jgi:NitT/TauT family transport system substrate-binding protein